VDVFALVELAAYAAAFWLFVVSAEFRRARIAEFAAAGNGRRAAMLLEATLATACGLAPAAMAATLA
jgi:hypothetical protein